MFTGSSVVSLLFIWAFVFLSGITSTESLRCFSCNNVGNVSQCTTVKQCAIDEKCFTDAVGLGQSTVYTFGCRTSAQCLVSTTHLSMPVVGRDIDTKAASTECRQCCAVDICNEKLCNRQHEYITSTNGQCHDDPDYNCEVVSGLFNVCGDVNHAKLGCRKFCGLCDLVDGGWSNWTSWTACDVTCGNGQRSRVRSCTSPVPSQGGLDCVGDGKEVSNCIAGVCPIHGWWSGWSAWGECSQTCGVGLQRRDRSCSNPYPGPNGNPCFGDTRDDRVCFLGACADGHWSDWAAWGSCSATCDEGLMSRSRTCDNPSPSMFGKSCLGDKADYKACTIHACPAQVVLFTVHTPTGQLNHATPLFSIIVNNIGNGYNKTTGQFRCPVPGVYQFSVTMLTTPGYCYCNIRYNGTNGVGAFSKDLSASYSSASASEYLALAIGDVVDLQCDGWDKVSQGSYTSFSGALITPN